VDEVMNDFLETQDVEGMRLAADSNLLDLEAVDRRCWIATFSCKGLVRNAAGAVRGHDLFGVGIRFPDDYLRVVNPAEILTWLGPKEIWHPNIKTPFICLGRIAPGTPLIDLLHRCFEVITFENIVMREDDALNKPACAWARRNRDRFPVDTRPIKRGAEPARIDVVEVRA